MGVKANPLLAVVGPNPPLEVFGTDVLAIVYKHADDDEDTMRVHCFGGQGEFKERRDGSLLLYDLADETGVEMSATKDGKIVVLKQVDGLPLAEDM